MENEKTKPFDIVATIFLIMIAALSDASDIVTDIIFAVPIVGQVVYFANAFLVSPIVWAVIQGWFIMKLGFFGKAGIINLAGGIANLVGIPGTTITTGIAIWLSNHPKITVIATTVTGKASAGKATTSNARAAGESGSARASRATGTFNGSAIREATTAEKKILAAEREDGEAMRGTKAKTETGTEERFGEEPTPFEQLQKLTEEPLPEEAENEEEEYS